MTEEVVKTDDIQVVSVKFRNRGKMYFFDPNGLVLSTGETVIVETAKGLEIGDVVQANHSVPADRVTQPLRPIVRIASEEDKHNAEQCRKKEREAYIICKRKIEEHGLEMKLVDVECSFEGNKILFFFSSDGRVDFRDLVKDLAGVFRTRIELRQIGVRDEARMLGGLGICGRPFCCGTFMDDFQPVSTKMAKTQSMSLNPSKISGTCGRLMCCLRYEQAAYEELVKNVPKNGAFVETPDGYGNVTQVNILRQTVKVKLDGPGDDSIRSYDAEDVAAIPGGRPRDGSQPPHVLVLKPKKPKETEEPVWERPELLISSPADLEKAATKPEESKKSGNRRRGKKDPSTTESQKSSQQKNASFKNSKNRTQKPAQQNTAVAKNESVSGEKTEGSGKSRNSRKRNRNRTQKPQGGAQQTPQPAVPEKRQAKSPSPVPAAKTENGEQKLKKNRNHRRSHKPRPKSGSENTGSTN